MASSRQGIERRGCFGTSGPSGLVYDVGDVGCISPDAADQGRRPTVLEPEPEEVEPRSLGNHAAVVTRIAIVTKDRQADPAVVRDETRAPDHDIGIDTTVLAEWLAVTHFGEPADASYTGPDDVRRRNADEGIG